MTKKKVPTVEPPKAIPFNGLVKLAKPGWEGVPDGPNPFYFGAGDGLFMHRHSLLGRGIAKVPFWPSSFPDMGIKTASFMFEAKPIPAKLMGQVVNFFERIYDRQHTEAAVLLIMHEETREWRIFVPTQMLSHGGVNYVFDPTHIRRPWIVVGSIHSHCDFGAGHSSTDTGDADGFEGLHCTIGMIKRPIPQIVAMVAMNKNYVHYKEDQFPFLFDFSEPKEHEAPEWWDRYCEDTRNKTKPVGFELFAKFKKSHEVKDEKSKTTIVQTSWQGTERPSWPPTSSWNRGKQEPYKYNPADWVKDPATGITRYLPAMQREEREALESRLERIQGIGVGRRPLGADDSDWTEFYRLQGLDGPPDGYAGYDPKDLLKRGFRWDPIEKTWEWINGAQPHSEILRESQEFNNRTKRDREDLELANELVPQDAYWESQLEDQFVSDLFDTEQVTDEDVDWAIQNPEMAADPTYWTDLMVRRAVRLVTFLNQQGMNIELSMKPGAKPSAKNPKSKQPRMKPGITEATMITKSGTTIKGPFALLPPVAGPTSEKGAN